MEQSAPRDHLLMAASVAFTMPAVVLFFAAQRYFVRGIVMSGLKGQRWCVTSDEQAKERPHAPGRSFRVGTKRYTIGIAVAEADTFFLFQSVEPAGATITKLVAR